MNTHSRSGWFIGVIAALAVSSFAGATPGQGVTASNVVISAPTDMAVRIKGSELVLDYGAKGARVNMLKVTQTFAPGAYSGWHTHAGPGYVIVTEGTLTIEEAKDCFIDYPKGSVLFEGGQDRIHNALNRTQTDVVLTAVFFLPAALPPGSNSRVDAPVQVAGCEDARKRH